MELSLAFIYLPTPDVHASLRYYRDVLGYNELWREGDTTVGLGVTGSDTALMISHAADHSEGGPGPIFMAPDVVQFLADNPELEPVAPPTPIPDGTMASFCDPGGNWFYILDQKDAAEG